MSVEWLMFGLAILSMIGTGIGISIRVGYVVAETAAKAVEVTDAKIGRIYERFDKYKEDIKTDFVRRESCALTHSATAMALESATKLAAEAYKELSAKVDKMGDKVDVLLMRGRGNDQA